MRASKGVGLSPSVSLDTGAARLDPSDADAYFIRAMSRSKLGGAPELILDDLDEAARLKPALAAFRDQARARLVKDKGPGR